MENFNLLKKYFWFNRFQNDDLLSNTTGIELKDKFII